MPRNLHRGGCNLHVRLRIPCEVEPKSVTEHGIWGDYRGEYLINIFLFFLKGV